MTIKVCHNKFSERLGKITHVLAIFTWYVFGGFKYFCTIFGIISITQIPNGNSWIFGILVGLVFGGIAWLIHVLEANDQGYDNDFVRLNKKLKLFQWREDC